MNVSQNRHAIFRKMYALHIPTPMVLCLAAILGCICNIIAVTKTHTPHGKIAVPSAEFLLILPAHSQTQVSLPLPIQPPGKSTL